jgi:hypothetical protein
MNEKALFLELLVSGFFAVACLKARAVDPRVTAVHPRDLVFLTDRVERMSRSRWQWFAMAGILVLVRLQTGVPMVVEITALLQLLLFLALPVAKQQQVAAVPARPRKNRTAKAPSWVSRSGAR